MRDLVRHFNPRIFQFAHLPILLATFSVIAHPAFGQDAGANKEFRAHRINGESPNIDGRFDEEIWTTAPAIDDFTQQEPDNMAAPRERTVVQVAYDDRFLYVAARCYRTRCRDNQLGTRTPREHSRERQARHRVSIPGTITSPAITSSSTRRACRATPRYFNDTREDSDYEAVWEVATSVTSEGWNAEFRIPFSQIRFAVPDGERSVWGFQVRRDVRETGEWDLWNAMPRGTQGFVSRFGHLVFADRLVPPRRIELMPFSLIRSEHDHEDGRSRGFDGGLDMRIGLGTSTTLSATINPDFGQVELDPAVLNLSVFETFFPEKRPFFLEDSRVFVLPYNQMPMFHSRRIGATPGRIELGDDEEIVSRPDQTTILGAAKVTGKANRWTYGGLAAWTAREFGIVETTTKDADGNESTSQARRLIEPASMFSVGRVQRDVLSGTSTVGAIATAVVREKDLDAFTGGGDYNIRWNNNLYTFNGHWVMTHAPIDGERKTDFGGVTNFDYIGKHVGVTGHFDHFGKNFRNTDLGFLSGRPEQELALRRPSGQRARSVEVLQELRCVLLRQQAVDRRRHDDFREHQLVGRHAAVELLERQLRRRP